MGHRMLVLDTPDGAMATVARHLREATAARDSVTVLADGEELLAAAREPCDLVLID